MEITNHLNQNGIFGLEGNCGEIPGQMKTLISLTQSPNIKIMEIGFNAGHSAEVFLKNNTTSTLLSFDIGLHNYIHVAKQYIDDTYPTRHTLIIGNSEVTVPEYVKANPDVKFDIIFIDGGHTYDNAKNDLENCYHLAHKDTILIFDDINCYDGPGKVWEEALQNNKVTQSNIGYFEHNRNMGWGKYVIE